MTPRILVGVCTFNEAGNIVRLIEQIRVALPAADILVVDDDSPDRTAALVRERFMTAMGQPQVHVIVRSERGLGGAIQTAMRSAISGGYDLFCNLDADFSHDPVALPDLVGPLTSDDRVDVAVGSRYVEGGGIIGWPLRRRIMSRMVNAFATFLLRLPVRDASGSFRCYRVAKLKEVWRESPTSDGYAFIQEILLDLHRGGAKCVEVPITFTDRVEGLSKLDHREAMRSVMTLVKLLHRRGPDAKN